MSQFRKKVDLNQPELVEKFRKLGAVVETIHTVGKGLPDLIVSINCAECLVEIKSSNAKLTKPQERFRKKWNGPLPIARNENDVENIVNALKRIGEIAKAIWSEHNVYYS